MPCPEAPLAKSDIVAPKSDVIVTKSVLSFAENVLMMKTVSNVVLIDTTLI